METGRKKAKEKYETVEVNGEILNLRPSTEIWVKDHVKDILNEYKTPYRVVKHHSIYKFNIGRGQNPKYLVTDPKTSIDIGDNDFVLNTVNLEDFEKKPSKGFLKRILKKYGMNDPEDVEGLIEQINPVFFEKVGAVRDEDFVKLKDMTSKELNELIDKTLEDGYQKDKEILYLLKPYLLRYDKNEISHEEAMPYNPHALLYTNSHVGKSFTAKKIGHKKDRISPSKLLGWAGADKKVEGFLNNKNKTVFCDEFQEDERENILSRALPLLQDGESDTETGIANINTKSWSPLVVMSNPKKETENEELISRFMNTLEKLGDNFGAFGSRVGLVVFREDFETIKKGNLMDKERNDRLQKIINFLMEKISPEFSKFVKEREVREWLNKSFEEDYKNEVKKRAESIGFTNVKEFWLNHLNSFHHSRGHALRNAFLEHISKILNKKYERSEILDTARNEFERIKEINLKSLRKMAEMAEEGEAEIAKAKLKSFTPEYARYFIMAVALEDHENGLEKNQYLPIEKIRDCYLENKEAMGIEEGSMYEKFAQVFNKLKKINKKRRIDIKNKFGIEIKELNENLMFSIKDKTEFGKYSKNVIDVIDVPNSVERGKGNNPSSSSSNSNNFDNNLTHNSKLNQILEEFKRDFPLQKVPTEELKRKIKEETERDEVEVMEYLLEEGIIDQTRKGFCEILQTEV